MVCEHLSVQAISPGWYERSMFERQMLEQGHIKGQEHIRGLVQRAS